MFAYLFGQSCSMPRLVAGNQGFDIFNIVIIKLTTLNCYDVIIIHNSTLQEVSLESSEKRIFFKKFFFPLNFLSKVSLFFSLEIYLVANSITNIASTIMPFNYERKKSIFFLPLKMETKKAKTSSLPPASSYRHFSPPLTELPCF